MQAGFSPKSKDDEICKTAFLSFKEAYTEAANFGFLKISNTP